GDLTRRRRFDLHLQDAGGPVHDLLQRLRLEEVEVVDRAEAIAERRGEAADARRRAHQREARQGKPEGAGAPPLAADDVEMAFLHRRLAAPLAPTGHAVGLDADPTGP